MNNDSFKERREAIKQITHEYGANYGKEIYELRERERVLYEKLARAHGVAFRLSEMINDPLVAPDTGTRLRDLANILVNL